MKVREPQFIAVGCGDQARQIAYLRHAGANPGLVWLQGFKSDMISLKACALADWASASGRGLLRFDYSGHGLSSGRFEDGTLSRWCEETETVFRNLTSGSQIVIGSSMGGNIALLLLRRLLARDPGEAERIGALILIAPAWDMTEELMWARFPEPAREAICRDGVWYRPSRYGDAPYPITRGLIEDGRRNLLGITRWRPGRPVHIIHGRADPDVPFSHSERLIEILDGSNIRLTAIPDGDHRLSRRQDLDILLAIVARTTALCS